MKNNKGFTLIELLVVIAIIGLLSTLAVVSLNNARAKARDAARVSDVKQLATLIEMAAANSKTGSYFELLPAACRAQGALTTTCGIWEGNDWATIKDPNGTAACAQANPTTGCQYTMGVNNALAGSDWYQICFVLEDGAGGLSKGMNRIGPGGRMNGAVTCAGGAVLAEGTGACCN
jgi:prepilin-type N-terminal cleavage/methylation domain-containing protein